jgi:hypothetical protein
MKFRRNEFYFFLWFAVIGCTPDRSVPDIIPPRVIAVLPDSGASNVSIKIKPTVIFSEPINPDSLESSTFIVVTSVGDYTGPIKGKFHCSGDSLIFTPDTDLWNNLGYTGLLTKNIMDMSGNRITSYTSWSFVTEPSEDVTSPEIIFMSPPPDGIDVSLDTKNIIVVFNEKLRPGTVNINSFFLGHSGTTTAGRIPGKISLNDSIIVFELEPGEKLWPNSNYRVILNSEIMDLAGNNFNGFSWHFRTAPNP